MHNLRFSIIFFALFYNSQLFSLNAIHQSLVQLTQYLHNLTNIIQSYSQKQKMEQKMVGKQEQIYIPPFSATAVEPPLIPQLQLGGLFKGKTYSQLKDILGTDLIQALVSARYLKENELALLGYNDAEKMYQPRVFYQGLACRSATCALQALKNAYYGIYTLSSNPSSFGYLLRNPDNLLQVCGKYLLEKGLSDGISWLDYDVLYKLHQAIQTGEFKTDLLPNNIQTIANRVYFIGQVDSSLKPEYISNIFNLINPKLKNKLSNDIINHIADLTTIILNAHNQAPISATSRETLEHEVQILQEINKFHTQKSSMLGFIIYQPGHYTSFIASKMDINTEYLFFDSLNGLLHDLTKINFNKLFTSQYLPDVVAALVYRYAFDEEQGTLVGFPSTWKGINIGLPNAKSVFNLLKKYQIPKTEAFKAYKPDFVQFLNNLKESIQKFQPDEQKQLEPSVTEMEQALQFQ
jgi:hypothetical protein